MTKVKVNDLVVFNHTLDAAVFRVKKIEGFNLGVVDRSLEDMPNAAIQWIDRACALPPSTGQLKALVA